MTDTIGLEEETITDQDNGFRIDCEKSAKGNDIKRRGKSGEIVDEYRQENS